MTKIVYNMLWRYKLSRYTIDILSEWDKGRRLKGYYIKDYISTNEEKDDNYLSIMTNFEIKLGTYVRRIKIKIK